MRITSAEFVTSVGRVDQLTKSDLPEFAFAGRSNVGKSSLINKLLNRKALAKTSNTPGKTRTLNYYLVNRRFHLVDLPGYGFAKRSGSERKKWATLIDAYLHDRPNLKGIVQLIDARHDPTREDADMLRWLLDEGAPFLLVATKADKLSKNKLAKRIRDTEKLVAQLADVPILTFSSETGQGRDEILAWIEGTIRV